MTKCWNYRVFCMGLLGALCTAGVVEPSEGADEAIRAAIEQSSQQLRELPATNVRVIVESGDVVLHGIVRLYSHKMEYERIAWTTDGVKEVENEIRVVPHVTVLDSDIEKHIRAIQNSHPRFHHAELRFVVDGGSVVIDATFEFPSDVLFLKHRVAEIEGVTAIAIISAFRV